jgi:hypothetical protein
MQTVLSSKSIGVLPGSSGAKSTDPSRPLTGHAKVINQAAVTAFMEQALQRGDIVEFKAAGNAQSRLLVNGKTTMIRAAILKAKAANTYFRLRRNTAADGDSEVAVLVLFHDGVSNIFMARTDMLPDRIVLNQKLTKFKDNWDVFKTVIPKAIVQPQTTTMKRFSLLPWLASMRTAISNKLGRVIKFLHRFVGPSLFR